MSAEVESRGIGPIERLASVEGVDEVSPDYRR